MRTSPFCTHAVAQMLKTASEPFFSSKITRSVRGRGGACSGSLSLKADSQNQTLRCLVLSFAATRKLLQRFTSWHGSFNSWEQKSMPPRLLFAAPCRSWDPLMHSSSSVPSSSWLPPSFRLMRPRPHAAHQRFLQKALLRSGSLMRRSTRRETAQGKQGILSRCNRCRICHGGETGQ